MILLTLKNLVSWIVYKGLEREPTPDNEWVVTLVTTLLVVFGLYKLGSCLFRVIKYFGKLWYQQVFSPG